MSRHRERIQRLAEYLRRQTSGIAPLLVFHSSELPLTTDAEMELARSEGRQILHVHFVKPDPTRGDNLGQ